MSLRGFFTHFILCQILFWIISSTNAAVEPSSRIATVGDNITFTCTNITGITWWYYKDHTKADPISPTKSSSLPNITEDKPNYLTIHRAVKEHTGVYSCSNGAMAELIVLEKDLECGYFNGFGHSSQRAVRPNERDPRCGGNVTLVCLILHKEDLTSEIEWMRSDGQTTHCSNHTSCDVPLVESSNVHYNVTVKLSIVGSSNLSKPSVSWSISISKLYAELCQDTTTTPRHDAPTQPSPFTSDPLPNTSPTFPDSTSSTSSPLTSETPMTPAAVIPSIPASNNTNYMILLGVGLILLTIFLIVVTVLLCKNSKRTRLAELQSMTYSQRMPMVYVPTPQANHPNGSSHMLFNSPTPTLPHRQYEEINGRVAASQPNITNNYQDRQNIEGFRTIPHTFPSTPHSNPPTYNSGPVSLHSTTGAGTGGTYLHTLRYAASTRPTPPSDKPEKPFEPATIPKQLELDFHSGSPSPLS